MLALRISSMLALVLACVLLIAAGVRFYGDPRIAQMRNIPAALEQFAEAGPGSARHAGTASPLVAQAEVLAAYINPPKPVAESPAAESESGPSPSPAAPAAQLKLHATSYYPDQPGRSMALVSDATSPESGQRWVKEGSQYRSFIIHEVRRGAITYREGDILCEASLDQGMRLPSLVRDPRGGSQRVSTAVEGAIQGMAAPAGPNDVQISDN